MVDQDLSARATASNRPQNPAPKFGVVLTERLALLAVFLCKRAAELCFIAGDLDRNGTIGLAADRIGVCAHERAHALAARVRQGARHAR